MIKRRVLVVEDSLTVRRRLIEVLSADPELEVVGEAGDGKTAIELCQSLRPDVITLDMMLPVMTGLAATEYIMAYCPTPILVVSASTNRGELFRTYEALAAGAVDVLEKPDGTEPEGSWERRLVSTVKLVSRIKVITHPRARLGSTVAARVQQPDLARFGTILTNGQVQCIAIGASTGGPAALVTILRALPESFPIPILLVMHIGPLFATALAEWLDAQSARSVTHAIHGERLPGFGEGRVVMAPPDRHLVIREGRLLLDDGPERHSCRPSVDVLFESVAKELGSKAAACLLTGMGRDGADGLLAIRRAGGRTIAQDQASSVVYGMPREAEIIGAAEQILSIEQVAPALAAFVRNDGEARGR
ncbi:MAG TPA: chemotaxis-specific protein-glutamate methyltransferase CheB [Polyangiaceae bacterium]|nr:chemotaxis-specific protein-glutamate methyltransferase CheB [Polyangiaceae bacterium]